MTITYHNQFTTNIGSLTTKHRPSNRNSSGANPNCRRTYETAELDELEVSGESSTHWLLMCPTCTKKRGDDHPSHGKLYWSKIKNIGLCYQCNTVFFPSKPDNVDESEWELKNTISRVSSSLNKYSEFKDPTPISFDFDVLDLDMRKYLHGRNPFLLSLIKPLGIAGWSGSKKGVVLPFIHKSDICLFQARFLVPRHGDEDPYYTCPGQRIPYSPFHIFSDYKLIDEDTITICEGVFDAIALAIIGYPNPLGVIGGDLTDYQTYLIRKLMPSNAYIIMDDWDHSWIVRNKLRKNILSLSNTHIVTLNAKDPEEYLCQRIKEDQEFMKSCTDNVIEWVKMVI